MRSIKFRLNLVVIFAFGAAGYFAWKAAEWHYQAKFLQVQIIRAVELKNEIEGLAYDKFSQETFTHLQNARRNLPVPGLRDEFSDVLQAYAVQDQKLVKKRVNIFLASSQQQFQKNLKDFDFVDTYAEEDIAIALISALCAIFWMRVTVELHLFKSLERLSRHMIDFLMDHYTFKFAQPDENELGGLQRTFNSLAERVINSMDELKRLDQAKSEFLSIASHELRTPMTSIKGSLSLLATGVMGPIDPSPMRLIHIAEFETDRLIRLINDILDLAKIEAGRLPLARAWHSWDDSVTKTAEGLMGLAHRAGVGIEVYSAPGLEIYIDRDRIQQVMTNLISNSIKFSPAGSSVVISTEKTASGALSVNVKDSGPGISTADQDLIFQKFRQGSNMENPLVKGTGLGLAIAKALVEEHGGVIGVKSVPGQGSTFWFTLPKWRDDELTSEGTAA